MFDESGRVFVARDQSPGKLAGQYFAGRDARDGKITADRIVVGLGRKLDSRVRETTTLFTYSCPGCGKQHLAEAAFDGAFQARCLRCTETFLVTDEIVHGVHVTALAHETVPLLEEAITA